MDDGARGRREQAANRELIYGGGALAGLVLDVELRKATDERVGLPELMRSLYAEFAKPGRTLALEDIERHAKQISGKDLGPVLRRVVDSKEFFDIKPYYAEVGLKLETFFYDEVSVRLEPKASDVQQRRFKAIFGAR